MNVYKLYFSPFNIIHRNLFQFKELQNYTFVSCSYHSSISTARRFLGATEGDEAKSNPNLCNRLLPASFLAVAITEK